jgi:subtilisin family serine protease
VLPALSAPAAAGGAAAADVEWAPGRLLLVPRAGFADAKLDQLLAGWGARQRRVGTSELRIVTLGARGGEAAVAAALARHPGIKFAEVARRVPAAHVANDPYAGSQWHLGQIGAGTAWDLAQGSGVTIAILDSGVDTKHPDLAAQAVPGWNFLDNNADTSDVNGHGTAVAGAALAVLDNAVGIAGLAGHARLMPVRIADANAYAYWSTVAQGLVWAADHGARVANISYVGVAASQSVQNAAQYLRGKGGLVVVCAGNNAVDEQIAPTTTMIPVSATDANDALTSFSSWGKFVALAAPGMNIWTTVRGTGYQAWWGTSMASPIVAGVAGLMMAAKPTLANTQIESLLYATAADLGAAGRDPYFGYGRVDAARAVQAAAARIRSAPNSTCSPPASTSPCTRSPSSRCRRPPSASPSVERRAASPTPARA